MTERVVCKRADLADGTLTPVLDGRVLITLSAGEPVAVAARCPHQGADLAEFHGLPRQHGLAPGLLGGGLGGLLVGGPIRRRSISC